VLDPDHEPSPYLLERVLGYFEDPSVGVTYTDARVIRADGTIEPYLTSGDAHPIDSFPELARRNPIAALTATLRTDAVRSVGGYARWLWGGQDYHLYLKLAAAGWRFAYVDRPLATYRWPDDHGGMSSDTRRVILNDLKLFAAFKLRHPFIPGPGRRVMGLAPRALLGSTGRRTRPAKAPERLGVVTLVDRLGRVGGAENLALEITTRLDATRFDRTLVVSRWSSEHAADPHLRSVLAELERGGVRFIGLERRSAFGVWGWAPLLGLLRCGEVDVIHAHMFGSNAWGTLLGRLARVPVVVAHEHTWSFEGEPVRQLVDRHLIGRFSDALVAVSEEDRRKMIEVERIAPDGIVFIPNGIELDCPPSGADIRAELGIPASAPVVGAVGNLRAQKATWVLLEAAAELTREFPDLRVLLIGDGPEAEHLERLQRKLGIERSVTMLGQRNDVRQILRGLDVGVLSSDFEGSPLAVMEYMNAALPVVATRVGGIPDLVEEGATGLLVARRRPRDLAEAIATLLRDRDGAARMGERGRERLHREFSISTTVQRVEELYLRVYGERMVAED